MNTHSPQRPSIVSLICGAFLAFDLGVLTILAWRIFVVEGNHWSFDNRILIWVSAAQVLILLAIALSRKSFAGIIRLSFVLGILTLAVSWLCIEWNLVLPYHQWIERGMPTSGNQKTDRKAGSSQLRFSAWKALLDLGKVSLREFKGCSFATLPEHRDMHTFVASVMGAGVGVAKPEGEPKPYGEAKYLLGLRCQSQAGSDRWFVCSLDSNDLRRTGEEHLGLSFQFDSSTRQINKESIKCFY